MPLVPEPDEMVDPPIDGAPPLLTPAGPVLDTTESNPALSTVVHIANKEDEEMIMEDSVEEGRSPNGNSHDQQMLSQSLPWATDYTMEEGRLSNDNTHKLMYSSAPSAFFSSASKSGSGSHSGF